jgi:2-oxoglutarate ferredoxin oxidoreductase subunit beta
MQRCPAYTSNLFENYQNNPEQIAVLTHAKGIPLNEHLKRIFKNQVVHDPSDLNAAQALAQRTDKLYIGLFYHNPNAPCYEEFTYQGLDMSDDDKIRALNRELDKFAVVSKQTANPA